MFLRFIRQADRVAGTVAHKGATMIKKKILNANRIRKIKGGFSFVPHRFVGDGFLGALDQKELLLYLFLVIVADRHGLSFYGYDRICSLLELSLNEYIHARDKLIEMDLIDFDGTIFQVLELPPKPIHGPKEPLHPQIATLIHKTAQSREYDR
jgi:hypothetical protein